MLRNLPKAHQGQSRVLEPGILTLGFTYIFGSSGSLAWEMEAKVGMQMT